MKNISTKKILSVGCAFVMATGAAAPVFGQLAEIRPPAAIGAFDAAASVSGIHPAGNALPPGGIAALVPAIVSSPDSTRIAPVAAPLRALVSLPIAAASLPASAAPPSTTPSGSFRAAQDLAIRLAPQAGETAGSGQAAATLDRVFDKTVATDDGDLSFSGRRFPDGEIEIINHNPRETLGRRATITHELKSPADLIQTLFMIENLHSYGAARVDLNLIGWRASADDGLPRLLRSFSDGVSLHQEGGAEAVIPEPWTRTTAAAPSGVDEVLYIQERFGPLAAQAAKTGAHPARRVLVRKADALDGWSVELPKDLSNRRVFLIHSVENEERAAELLLTLIALRNSGVGSVTLLNTYEGYARQDQQWKAGQTIGALAMLKAINIFADRHLGINIHYTDKIKDGLFHGEAIESVNGFTALARRMFRDLARENGVEDGSPSSPVIRERLGAAFEGRALILVGPDDGAYPMVRDAALALSRWILERWKISIDVRAAYIDKKRSDAHTVEMAGGLLTGPGRPLELAPGQSFEDAAAFVLDDETAQGSTLLSATYALVKRMGLSWQRVYTGVIQGKLNRGLEPLDSGWSAEELKSARLPANIDDARGRMPPYRFFATESIHLPDELRGSKVSLRSLVAEIIGKIDGKD